MIQPPMPLCRRTVPQPDLGLGNGAGPIFTSGNHGRHIHSIGHGVTVAVLGQRQQLLDFLAQLRPDIVGVPPQA